MYRGKMETYGKEDFLQEGNIVAWEIISRGNFKGGKFSTYFGGAIRKRLRLIWVLLDGLLFIYFCFLSYHIFLNSHNHQDISFGTRVGR